MKIIAWLSDAASFLRWVFLAFVLVGVVVLGAGLLLLPARRPRPGPLRVTINPKPAAAATADAHLSQSSAGRLSGQAPISAAGGQAPVAPVTAGSGTGYSPPGGQIVPQGASCGLAPGDRVVVPVSGGIETVIRNARTGAELDRSTRPLTGETVVEVKDDLLQVETRWQDRLEIAIDLPAESPPAWRIGAVYDGGWEVYGRRDWRLVEIRRADVIGWVRLGVTAGGEVGAAAGVEVAF